MKRILIYLLLVISMAVFAQQQSDSTNDAEAQTEQPAAGEKAREGEGEDTGGEKAGAESPGEADASLIAQDDPDQVLTDGGDEEHQDEETEATVVIDPDESEFEPDEEISEDYPVPLPSDI